MFRTAETIFKSLLDIISHGSHEIMSSKDLKIVSAVLNIKDQIAFLMNYQNGGLET
jgi:hypothetical protein